MAALYMIYMNKLRCVQVVLTATDTSGAYRLSGGAPVTEHNGVARRHLA